MFCASAAIELHIRHSRTTMKSAGSKEQFRFLFNERSPASVSEKLQTRLSATVPDRLEVEQENIRAGLWFDKRRRS